MSRVRAFLIRLWPWLRHPFSLRLEGGCVGSGWLFNAKGEGALLPHIYYDWDPGWHASSRHFLGFMWYLGPKVLWVGLTDTN